MYLRKLAQDRHFKIACTIIAVCTFLAVISHLVVFHRIPALLKPQSWPPIRLHRIAEDIAGKTKSPKLVLTLAPLYALQGRCDIYTELSTGPFAYRIADFLTPAERQITNTVGPKTLKALLDNSPPTAVVLGVEPKVLEDPLFQTAIYPSREKWERKSYENGPIVYFRR